MRDRDLVRLHWPPELRAAFDALFAIDDAMASVVAGATQPALAAIKLAWWRERLEALDNAIVPAEPRLRAAAAELLPRGIGGGELAGLEEGWATLLQEAPSAQLVGQRGALLFRLAARLLGSGDPGLDAAGELYAVVDVRRRGFADFGRDRCLPRFARAVRPLTALAALARRDLRRPVPEPEGTPGRAWTLLRHRLTGR